MNINFNYAVKKGLTHDDVLTLLLVKFCSVKENRAGEDVVEICKQRDFSGIDKYIKKSKENNISLSKDGTSLLNDLAAFKKDLMSDEDRAIVHYIVDYCNKDPEYIVGNKQQILRSVVDLRLSTNFSASQLFTIMKHFLDSDDSLYFRKFEYLFWKPSNPYDKKFSLENSRLYNHYEKYKEELDKIL